MHAQVGNIESIQRRVSWLAARSVVSFPLQGQFRTQAREESLVHQQLLPSVPFTRCQVLFKEISITVQSARKGPRLPLHLSAHLPASLASLESRVQSSSLGWSGEMGFGQSGEERKHELTLVPYHIKKYIKKLIASCMSGGGKGRLKKEIIIDDSQLDGHHTLSTRSLI